MRPPSFAMRAAFALSVLTGMAMASPGKADQISDFYKGKTVSFVVGSPPGGAYDLYARAIAHYFPAHMPGKPQAIIQNMPGAGSLIAANYTSNVAPRDGTVVAALNSTAPYQKLFGIASVKFDPVVANWLPSPSGFTALLLVSKNAPVKTFAELRQTPTRIATLSPGATPSFFAAIFNDVFQTKIIPITGHPSMPDALIAMQRGEVDGFPSTPWTSLQRNYAHLLSSGEINILLQYGQARLSELKDVPFAQDIASTDEDKQLLDVTMAPTFLGFPYMMGPDVPPERIRAIRDAMMRVFDDAGFREEAARMKLDVAPVSGDDAQRIVRNAYSASASVTTRLRKIYDSQVK